MNNMIGEIYLLEIAICVALNVIGMRYLFSKETDKGFCGFTCQCASVVLWGILAHASCNGVLFNSITYTFESFAKWAVVMFISCSVFVGIRILNEIKHELNMEYATAYLLYVTVYYAMIMLCEKLFGNIELTTESMIDINNGIMGSYNDILLKVVPVIAIIAILINIGYWYTENQKNKNPEIEE